MLDFFRTGDRRGCRDVIQLFIALICEDSIMPVTLVDKLLESFDKLDQCITVTRDVLGAKSEVPEGVMSRIEYYTEIVAKQRELTSSLREHLSTSNWAEVSRHVRLINGYSTMIREDAQDILSGAVANNIPENKSEALLS